MSFDRVNLTGTDCSDDEAHPPSCTAPVIDGPNKKPRRSGRHENDVGSSSKTSSDIIDEAIDNVLRKSISRENRRDAEATCSDCSALCVQVHVCSGFTSKVTPLQGDTASSQIISAGVVTDIPSLSNAVSVPSYANIAS